VRTAEVLAALSACGVAVRLASDGTIRLPRVAAERHPDLVAELKTHRVEAVSLLRGHPSPAHPCIRCGGESAPEDLFCRVECFECWKAERAARRDRTGAAP
jgi:hypothetical protein